MVHARCERSSPDTLRDLTSCRRITSRAERGGGLAKYKWSGALATLGRAKAADWPSDGIPPRSLDCDQVRWAGPHGTARRARLIFVLDHPRDCEPVAQQKPLCELSSLNAKFRIKVSIASSMSNRSLPSIKYPALESHLDLRASSRAIACVATILLCALEYGDRERLYEG